MKRVSKGVEPQSLGSYRSSAPNSTWDQMKSDPNWGGPSAYSDCRSQLLLDQGGICAYCEIDIRDDDPLKCRVEHFHPKSDITPLKNWALDWGNLYGVCAGGSFKHGQAPHTLEPLAKNLSCDAHKDQQIQAKVLTAQCEGWILNPADLIASPPVFRLNRSSGELSPDPSACQALLGQVLNHHATPDALVQHTIEMLNLNCDRLCQARLVVIRNIENQKKRQREQGFNGQQGMANLAARYFGRHWPNFFTTVRLCLGLAAETHLTSIQYQG